MTTNQKKSKFGPMKTFNINCRLSEDLKDTVEYIKATEGLTTWIERKMREVPVDENLMAAIRQARQV